MSNNRQQKISEYLDSRGACTYEELAELLNVSSMTIRRDIDKMAGNGAVIKTLGGIQKANAPVDFYESQLSQRLLLNRIEKKIIAREALKHIENSATIFLDGSTTCLELAKLLASDGRQLTIITHSLLICQILGRNRGNTIITIGGQYDPENYCYVGPGSEEQARKFYANKAFISTRGFMPTEGTYESSVGVFRIKQIMAGRSEQVILLVDHSKFGKRALCKALDIALINKVVTDSGVSAEDVSLLEKSGQAVIVAAVEHYEADMLNDTKDTDRKTPALIKGK